MAAPPVRNLGRMDTKTRMAFLAGALAITLASGWGTVSASSIYENHFDVYRTLKTADAPRDRSAKPRPAQVARHRAATSPVVLSETPHGKTPGTR